MSEKLDPDPNKTTSSGFATLIPWKDRYFQAGVERSSHIAPPLSALLPFRILGLKDTRDAWVWFPRPGKYSHAGGSEPAGVNMII